MKGVTTVSPNDTWGRKGVDPSVTFFEISKTALKNMLFCKIKNVTSHGGWGVYKTISLCHQMEGGGIKSVEKFHVLFEWPLI